MKRFAAALALSAFAIAYGPAFAQEKKSEPAKEEAKKAEAKKEQGKKKVKKGGC
ncbi:MAG: hypothetical protein ACRECQ_12935 [Burkholderiaceae bacterium]